MGSDRPSNRRNAQWKRLGQTLFPLPPRCPLAALSVNVSLPPPKHSVALSPSHVLCFSSALGEMGAPTVMIGPLQQSFCTDTHTGNVCRDWTYSGNRTTTLCLQEPLWILQNTMRWGSAVFFFFFADIPTFVSLSLVCWNRPSAHSTSEWFHFSYPSERFWQQFGVYWISGYACFD